MFKPSRHGVAIIHSTGKKGVTAALAAMLLVFIWTAQSVTAGEEEKVVLLSGVGIELTQKDFEIYKNIIEKGAFRTSDENHMIAVVKTWLFAAEAVNRKFDESFPGTFPGDEKLDENKRVLWRIKLADIYIDMALKEYPVSEASILSHYRSHPPYDTELTEEHRAEIRSRIVHARRNLILDAEAEYLKKKWKFQRVAEKADGQEFDAAEAMKKITFMENAAYGPEDFWTDEKFKIAFVRYWTTRLSDRAGEESLGLETHHVQDMAPVGRYREFIEKFSKNELVALELKDRVYQTEYACEIQFNLVIKNPNGETKKYYYRDPWVKVHGEWRHLFQNPVLFPEIN